MIVKRRQFRHKNKIFTPSFSIIFASFMVLLLFVGYLRFGEGIKEGASNAFSGISLPSISLSVPKFNFSLPSIPKVSISLPNISLPDLSSLKSKTAGNVSNATQIEPKTKTSLALENAPVNIPEPQKLKEDSSFDVVIDSQEVQDGNLVAVFHHNSNQVQPIRVEGDVKYSLSASESSSNQSVKLTIYNWTDQYFRLIVGSTSEVLGFGKAKKKTIDTSIKDHSGNDIDSGIEIIDKELHNVVYNNTGKKHNAQINEGKYDVRVTPHGNNINSIYFENVNIFSNISKIVNLDEPEDKQGNLELYVVDPTGLNFTRAKVTVNSALGNTLSKCKEWNFTTRNCDGRWEDIKHLEPGKSYDFYITPGDPALSTNAKGSFFDGFESGSFATNAWFNNSVGSTNNGEKWLVSTSSPITGTFSALASGSSFTARLWTNVSTAGWKNISVSFSLVTTASATMSTSAWNGTAWRLLKNFTASTASHKYISNFTGITGTENQTSPRFELKFICVLGTGTRSCKVDNFNVTGIVAIYPLIKASTNRTTTTTAVLNWTTDRPSNTSVIYGTAVGVAGLTSIRRINNAVTIHNVTLTGLSSGTKYFYNISSDYFGNTKMNGTYSFTTTAVAVSSISASTNRTTFSTAVINWTTDQNSNTTVNYGKTASLGTKRSIQNSVTLHNVTLIGLRAGTKYFYNVSSCTSAGCKVNNTPSFKFLTSPNLSISGWSASGIKKTTAVINWTTNLASNTSVNYGITPSLGTTRAIQNSVTLHNVSLSGLSDGLLYYVNVSSCTLDGNCKVNNTPSFTFMTAQSVPNITAVHDAPDPIFENKKITIDANITVGVHQISSAWVSINGTNYTMTTNRNSVLFDGFESGVFSANRWENITTSTGTEAWLVTSSGPLSGTFSAIASGSSFTAWLYDNISTFGWRNISLSYTKSTTANAALSASFWNGTAWTLIKNQSGAIASSTFKGNFSNHPEIENQTSPRFRLRFICELTTGVRTCLIDNVNVTGIPRRGANMNWNLTYNVTTLSGLVNYVVYSNNTGDVNATPRQGSFTVNPPPVFISSLNKSGITTSKSVINWTTNLASNTTIRYGTTPSLGTKRTIQNLLTLHNMTLMGLRAGTLYFFNLSSCYRSSCALNNTPSFTFTTTANLTISSLNKSGVTINSAVINWTTNLASNTTINYGTTASLGTIRRVNDAVTAHNITLFSLSGSTLYFFNVSSCATNNNCKENNTPSFTFTTPSSNTAPSIVFFNVTPTPTLPSQRVNFTANVTDTQDNVQVVKFTFNNTNRTMKRIGTTITYYNDTTSISKLYAGTYRFTVYANDTGGLDATSKSSNLIISAVTSIQVFNTPINFSSGFAGDLLNATSLHGFPLFVKNTGNVNISLNISGTNLTGKLNSQKIKSTFVEWDNNSLFSVIRKLNYSHTLVISSLNINKNSSFFFRLRTPTGIMSQNFSGNVTFTAKS